MVWCLCIIGALAALYLIVSCVVFHLTCRRFPDSHDPMRPLTHATDELLAPYAEMIQSGRRWIQAHTAVPVEMTSFDGLTLRASLYEHPEAKAVLVACHGYHSDGVRDFAAACEFYYDHGMSLLLIDQRAAGASEGRYITFGVKESADVRGWCALVEKRFPGLPILLSGISMGASAVLMTADDLPEGVKALLADCGYTSPRDELAYVARHYIGRAAVVLLPGVALWCRLLGGFGLRERTTEKALSRCTRPVFFIHGQADELVPHENSVKNRAACSAPTEFLSVPGADHGLSYLVDPDGYHELADKFLKAYVLPQPPDGQ